MGYRQYLYSVDQFLVDEIRKCKTKEEFISTMQKFRNEIVEYDKYDDSYYISFSGIGKELHEFGKYYENSDEMYKHGDSLFTSDELNEEYSDYGIIVLDEEGLLCAIEWQRKKVQSLYEDLLLEKSSNSWDDRTQLQRLIMHSRDYLYWWKGKGPGDFNKDNDCIVSSWLYEHTYFELIKIYKTFDWDNNAMLFFGW